MTVVLRILFLMMMVFGLGFSQADSNPEFDKKIQNLNLLLDSNRSSNAVAKVAPTGTPDFGALALRLGFSLAVVLGLIYVLYRLARKVRRMDLPPSEGGKSIQMLESYFVGPHQKVLLIRVGENRVLLVGATQDSMRTLLQVEGEEAKAMLQNAKSAVVTPAQFSETVNQMLSRFRKDSGK